MELKLAYGKTGLPVRIPDSNVGGIVHMIQAHPVENPQDAIAQALQTPIASRPLREIAQGRSSAVIVISDITRPVPNRLLLPPILQTIEAAGIPAKKSPS